MLPTPASRDYRAPNAKPYRERGGGKKGEQLPNHIGGSLNPEFVAWMMDFPPGWMDLPASGQPKTPTRRASRKACPTESTS